MPHDLAQLREAVAGQAPVTGPRVPRRLVPRERWQLERRQRVLEVPPNRVAVQMGTVAVPGRRWLRNTDRHPVFRRFLRDAAAFIATNINAASIDRVAVGPAPCANFKPARFRHSIKADAAKRIRAA